MKEGYVIMSACYQQWLLNQLMDFHDTWFENHTIRGYNTLVPFNSHLQYTNMASSFTVITNEPLEVGT
jgi:hypothetical protein